MDQTDLKYSIVVGSRVCYSQRSTHTLEPATVTALNPWTGTATVRRDSDQALRTVKLSKLYRITLRDLLGDF